jgi:glycosyltransferase involved in cell wall biosynthesis
VNILVIHQHYLAEGQPGSSRFNEFAALWRQSGHNVVVIAGTVNYATGDAIAGLRRQWVTRRTESGVEVWRCHVPTTYNKGYVGRMWAFMVFTLSATFAAVRASKPDVVIASSPPLTTAVTGWIAARRHRAPWVFEICDLWPESAVTTGVLSKSALLTRFLYRLEAWACRTATKINVLTPAFREDLLSRKLAPSEKIVFIPNGADLTAFSPGPRNNHVRQRFGWDDRIVVLYAGAHGRANAVQQLVDAADHLKHRPDILICTVGDGPERQRWQAEAERRGLDNIQFVGAQPKAQMPDIVNACDIGAAVLQNNPTFRTVYPNKIFDYMACARPVLLAIDGVARELVCEQAKAGLYAEPENAEDLAAVITSLADDEQARRQMGTNGRNWVTANASREVLAQRYLTVLTDLSPGAGPSDRDVGPSMDREPASRPHG